MWIDRLLQSRTRHALELSARFAEQRQRVLAENVANIDTPDYQTRRLDENRFQAALRGALQRARSGDEQQLTLRDAQFRTNERGTLIAKPQIEPAENILFQDGTNARLEKLMTQAGENALLHRFVTARLKSTFERLQTAIRGRL